jgi:hypothetical protein
MASKESFAVLKLEDKNILGRVTGISTSEISIQTISEDDIDLGSNMHLDVIADGKIYHRGLPVKVISDNHVENEISFATMLVREIKVVFQ